MRLTGVVVVALALALTPWAAPAQAGPAYEKSGKYDDYPTFEGKVVTMDADAGRISLRGDDGFRTFSTAPKKLGGLEKGMPVRVTYEQTGSGNRAIQIVRLVIPEGASTDAEIAEAKERLEKDGVLQAQPEDGSP
ncbi:MAG: hypothetical protein Q8R92_18785 [Deltaproteobacteria bacterium]|nr:hypothetical protein [Deltaproteobacteria bacterium]